MRSSASSNGVVSNSPITTNPNNIFMPMLPRLCKSPNTSFRCFSSLSHPPPLRYAVLGAGFAGLSVAWHLLKHSPRESHMCVDIYDEGGIGAGASGVSGGLLHPYSPKVKPLWRGAECWTESIELLNIAEEALSSREPKLTNFFDQDLNGSVFKRRGILRPALNSKSLTAMNDNARNCISSCRVEGIDEEAAKNLVPNIRVPLNSAYYMPEAVNINPHRYLQGLFLACTNLSEDMSKLASGRKEFALHQRTVNSAHELAEDYEAVVICLGAKADTLPELSGKLPLRTCRGVIAHLQLPDNSREVYPDHGPSILSDAWIAVQGPNDLYIGATWEWRSRNYSPLVSDEEALKSFQELLPKASAVYPSIKNWAIVGARAGLRAMPPLTPHGSLPLLGSIDDLVENTSNCKYWIFGGLGSRGLLYHGLLGKLMAEAVLSAKESVIPHELTSWKRNK